MSEVIDIAELDKGRVVAALYNASRPLGLGLLHFRPEEMSAAEGGRHFEACQGDFDYLQGRVMKVDLSQDTFDPTLYDRDNGTGAAQCVIEQLRTCDA